MLTSGNYHLSILAWKTYTMIRFNSLRIIFNFLTILNLIRWPSKPVEINLKTKAIISKTKSLTFRSNIQLTNVNSSKSRIIYWNAPSQNFRLTFRKKFIASHMLIYRLQHKFYFLLFTSVTIVTQVSNK